MIRGEWRWEGIGEGEGGREMVRGYGKDRRKEASNLRISKVTYSLTRSMDVLNSS